uniref:DYW domain-containing protein n=1 Tax=Kalanchoe fedtschenkoi TaxID=63787 RepID=A0A7N0TP41_KALFE
MSGALASSKALQIQKRSFNSFKHVHAHLLCSGLHHDSYCLNMLLKLCFDSRDLDYARLLFHHIERPTIFLWNTMIQGLVANDCCSEGIQMYHWMRRESCFLPNNFTFPFVLKACARVSDCHLGLSLHNLLVKVGFDSDVFVGTSLVCLYAKLGHLNYARQVFDDIPEKNVISWTALVRGYADAGRFREAVDTFKRMLSVGLKPDSYMLVLILSAYTQLGGSSSMEWIHKYVVDVGMHRNVFVATCLLDMYVKYGDMEKARSIFDSMPEKDIVSWNTMIQGYASNGLPDQVLNIFSRMRDANLKLNCYSLVGVLSACASLGALEFGEWASSFIDRNEFLSNRILGTALIDMYAKCGSMPSAMTVFNGMKDRDIIFWNSILNGLAMNGYDQATFAVFGQFEKSGFRPNKNTFIGLLCACTHAGLINLGRQFFYSIKNVYSLDPSVEHYGCMVDLLGRGGLLVEADQLIKCMPMEPNAVVWGALLAGCRMFRNNQMAERVLVKLIELEPLNSGNYVQLSKMYSATGRWEAAANIRSSMIENGIEKTPGYSWIEVNGVVHKFLVGDNYNPMSDHIYAKMEELMKDVRAAGYVPTTESVLFDIENEEKQHFIAHHSEKLAVAFGLMSLPSPRTIRVMKNLRVCGDCHEFLKLVSRITDRQIVVRDNNRFHYFADGSCSCKDYW